MNNVKKIQVLICSCLLLSLRSFAQDGRKNNSFIEPQMVFVKGGTFIMGNNKANPNEKPEHKVTLHDFYIGKYEVTQAQWHAIMHTSPSAFSRCDDGPEENISWNEVQIFIRKINAFTGKHYRLPTES